MKLNELDLQHLRAAIAIAARAREHGNHPFGALLTDANGTVLLQAENSVVMERDCTGHAETNLMRLASAKFEPEFLATCTLYSSCEPCAMCSGAMYWGNVGRVVYALSEENLYKLTGAHPENPTLKMPCRELFAHGQRAIQVEGPALEQEAVQVHQGFWT